jgi:branched-chain amino acid transport system ATP-binding protein
MIAVLDSSLASFLGLTVLLFGGAAFLTGQALAETWRPQWHLYPYGLLMGVADRFMTFALGGWPLLSVTGLMIQAGVLTGLMLVGYRLTLAHKMVTQYPWLYRRSGLFGWVDKA